MKFSEKVVGFTLVAEHNNNVSFEYKGQSLKSFGDNTGIPFIVKFNGVQNPEKKAKILPGYQMH